ncbi:unnamed protein product [Ilex paraguariensis]|uniref:Uncharacterized protein n=1 Tax=Ilex paraguariensis TaxID=185542 RepID=A0ABC8U8H6_9AQUA
MKVDEKIVEERHEMDKLVEPLSALFDAIWHENSRERQNTRSTQTEPIEEFDQQAKLQKSLAN